MAFTFEFNDGNTYEVTEVTSFGKDYDVASNKVSRFWAECSDYKGIISERVYTKFQEIIPSKEKLE